MNLWEMFAGFGWMFCCLGMVQQQEQNWPQQFKKNVNIAVWVAEIVQRCFVLLTRNKFGLQALGLPCLLAVGLMWIWATVTQDLLMFGWMAMWGLLYVTRRMEAKKIEGRVPSEYDGWPFDAMRYCKSEITAKRIVEPIMLAIVGLIAFKVYEYQHWNYTGLPYFFFAGAICVSFVAAVQERIWKRQLQAMRDGELLNQMRGMDYRDRYGE